MSDKSGPLAPSAELDAMVTTVEERHRTEFTIKLQDSKSWFYLCKDDLDYNNITRCGLSQFVQDFHEHLRRKRYIDNATKDVCAVLRWCRPPDLRSPDICGLCPVLFDSPSTVFGHIFRERRRGYQHVGTGPSKRK
jgi:hypothetical protein